MKMVLFNNLIESYKTDQTFRILAQGLAMIMIPITYLIIARAWGIHV